MPNVPSKLRVSGDTTGRWDDLKSSSERLRGGVRLLGTSLEGIVGSNPLLSSFLEHTVNNFVQTFLL